MDDTEKDVMKEALGVLDDLKSYAQSNKEIVEEYSTRTSFDPDVLKRYRTYRMTEGRGWDDDPLQKSEEKTTHPDIVAAACRKLLEIVATFCSCGEPDRLAPYFEALKRNGIDIKVNMPTAESKADDLDEFISLSRENYRDMWGLDQHLKEDLAPQAEEEGIAPKKKFGEIARLQYTITYGKGKTQKMEERIEHEKDLNIMHNDALTAL